MRTYKTIHVEASDVKVCDTVSCDRCHKLIEPDAFNNPIQAGVDVEVGAGFGSRHDGLDVHLDCCDECADWLLGEFEHKEE